MVMKITFDEVLSEKEFLHSEILSSLTSDVLTKKVMKDGFYDVKLLVNGIELEPKMFNDIVQNIARYVDREAEKLVNERIEQIQYKIDSLNEIIEEATCKIKEKFKIIDED